MITSFIPFNYSLYITFVHKLNPCVKIVLSFLYLFLSFISFNNSFLNIISILLNIFFLLFMFILIKINPKTILKQVFKAKYLILFIFIANVLSTKQNLYEINIFFTLDNLLPAILKTLKIIFRFFKAISISNILIKTTTSQEISHGLMLLMYPLKFFGIHIETIGMMMNISISFIPVFFREISRLYKAQKSRGRRTDTFLNKISMFIAIINPLFNFIFKSEKLLTAILESRGYKLNSKRTYYRKMIFSMKDIYAIIFMIFFSLFFLVFKILEKTSFMLI